MKDRLAVLRSLLAEGKLSTQDELRQKLEKLQFHVTQSTISRDLRRIGAVRAVDGEGNTVYRLPGVVPPVASEEGGVIRDIQSNGHMVVIHTEPGLSSMVARHIDMRRNSDFLGTLAGEDTVFVALAREQEAREGVRKVRELLAGIE